MNFLLVLSGPSLKFTGNLYPSNSNPLTSPLLYKHMYLLTLLQISTYLLQSPIHEFLFSLDLKFGTPCGCKSFYFSVFSLDPVPLIFVYLLVVSDLKFLSITIVKTQRCLTISYFRSVNGKFKHQSSTTYCSPCVKVTSPSPLV